MVGFIQNVMWDSNWTKVAGFLILLGESSNLSSQVIDCENDLGNLGFVVGCCLTNYFVRANKRSFGTILFLLEVNSFPNQPKIFNGHLRSC